MQSAYLVRDKTHGADRNGKMIANLTLTDATGEVNARIFEKVEQMVAGFEAGDVVWIKGFVQLYQNRKQVIVNEIRRATEEEYRLQDLVADLGGDPREHLAAIEARVAELSSPWVRQLIELTLNDETVRAQILSAPAAKTIHHAYRGGLIEHIRSIVDVMCSLAELYPYLDRDYLIFGAIYHDIGKLKELELSDGIRYTDEGRLVGHMNTACQMIDSFASSIEGFPEDQKLILKHIVLSHHGRLEYGSPKLPVMIEAIVVAMIDDLDSKLNTLFHFMKNEMQNVPDDEKWTHYHSGFDRYLFLDVFRKKMSSIK